MTNALTEAQTRQSAWPAALWSTAAAAGITAAIFATLLVLEQRQADITDPLADPHVSQLRREYLSNPTDEQLRLRYYQADLQARAEYYLGRKRIGYAAAACALLSGIAVVSGVTAILLRGPRPAPGPSIDRTAEELKTASRGRWAVCGLAVALAATSGAVAYTAWANRRVSVELGASETDATVAETRPAAIPPGPDLPELAKHWPRFRGPGGTGVFEGNVPSNWDGPSGRGVLWSAAIPLPGQNSPVIWGDRVFLAGATPDEREVYCFDAQDGRRLWTTPVDTPQGRRLPAPTTWADNNAASTCAVDGSRVYAIFPNGDLAAIDFDGQVAWSHNLGPLADLYGHASSLCTYKGLLLVQLDQDQSTTGERHAKLIAFNSATGERVWAQRRQVSGSWMSPIVVDAGGRVQVIAGGDPRLISHDVRTGRVLWWAKVLGADVAPSPILAGGLIFTAQPHGYVTAISPDGDGNVTGSDRIAWSDDTVVPDVPSPLSDGKRLWTLTDDGYLLCRNLADGRAIYEHDLRVNFEASPSLAGGRIYLTDTDGRTYVIGSGDAFEQIAVCELGQGVQASMAFATGRIYLRGLSDLFCIGGSAE